MATPDTIIPTIPEFFAGRDIFITGGTGFMGKVLIEKLLRSCPNINKIFILIRSKKNIAAQDRIECIKKLPLFDRLRQERPENMNKIVPINGDVTMLDLGLSDDDRKKMENVSIVFHAAASVRFDDPLHEAVIMNTRGTREVCIFAEKLKHLKVMVHVSTTYSNPRIHVVSETIYPPNADWQKAIQIAETYPDELNIMTEKFTDYDPNTYTFTKGLAEQVVNDYKDRLPIIVYRPSIVISTMDEPIAGWVDNFNGPVGMLLASGIGLCRTSYGDPEIVSDFTPVDTSIKAMIIAVWKRGTREPEEPLAVYNCSTSLQRKFTTAFIAKMGEELSYHIPMDKMLWKPGGSITKCRYHNFIKVILLHICSAYILDILLKFSGQKQFLVKLQRKIYAANLALLYFMTTHWIFKNEKFLSLQSCLKQCDLKDFTFDNFITADVRDYFINCMLGARRYLLHEKDENLPRARRNYQRMAIIDRISRIILLALLAYVTYSLVLYRLFITNTVHPLQI